MNVTGWVLISVSKLTFMKSCWQLLSVVAHVATNGCLSTNKCLSAHKTTTFGSVTKLGRLSSNFLLVEGREYRKVPEK